jgi:hypothetical protein
VRRIFGLAFCFLLLASECGLAIADDGAGEGYAHGPWHFRAITCVDAVVRGVGTRIPTNGQPTAHDFNEIGADVWYSTGLGLSPIFPNAHAGIVDYGHTPADEVIAAERPGDRVQVCFLGGPAPSADCNPDKDPRERRYRVYDYRQRREYSGVNGEHLCGGA